MGTEKYKNKIICGNCFDVLPSLKTESIDYILTSPPYDKIRDYDGFPILGKPERIQLAKECFRVLKNNSICSVVIQDETKNRRKSGTSFRWAVEWMDEGWGLFETTIYGRHGPPGAFWKKRFRVDHEYVHNFIKGDEPHFFNKEHMMVPTKNAGRMVSCDKRHKGGDTEDGEDFLCPDTKCRGTIWDYPSSNREGNKTKKKHPATMPDSLAGDLIRCFSAEGELVLDPMTGSGTTCVMAAKCNRDYIGIEFSAEYIQIIGERLENEIGDMFAEE